MLKLLRTPSTSRLQSIIFAILILLVFAISYGASRLLGGVLNAQTTVPSANSTGSGAAWVNPPFRVSDFTLPSHTGEPLSMSELRGKPVMLTFGYTHCPDVCPMTLANFRQVRELLGERGDDVQFLFISVDGQRDTPAVLNEYLSRFDSSFLGMQGQHEVLQQIAREYNLQASSDAEPVEHRHDDGSIHHHEPDESYFVEHTSPAFIIDAEGYLRTLYFFGASSESMAEGLLHILDEGA